MGRYIPPAALDAGLTSANAASGKGHALGSRARKIGQGILTVRFEMPFAVWCGSCPQPALIAQGVRFNAEKKKVGMYHSTPVWAFRIKHAACGGWLEIRTDPKNAEYVVHEGGKRRDYGELRDKEGVLGEILTEEERERRRNDAFAAFEGKVEEKEKGRVEGQRVEELLEDREKHWSDTYAANQRLRRSFRAERKVRHRNERDKQAIQDRLGLAVELLDETAADRQAAKLVGFGSEPAQDMMSVVSGRPLFKEKQHRSSAKPLAQKMKLQESLRGNTRAALDPFAVREQPNSVTDLKGMPRFKGAAHSRHEPQRVDTTSSVNVSDLPAPPVQALVAYDSD